MSSYRQIEEEHTLAEMLGLATADIIALHDDMADLCATIAGQFPDTHENIPKYQEAYQALRALDNARDVLTEPLERVDPPARNRPVLVMVGKQSRPNRAVSQRVRLGNVVVRLKSVEAALAEADQRGDLLREDLAATITELEDVTFPERYG